MAKKLIRTIKCTEVTLKGVNHLTEQVETMLLEVAGTFKDDKALEKAVRKVLPSDFTMMYITDSKEAAHKYVITEQEFLAHATRIDETVKE